MIVDLNTLTQQVTDVLSYSQGYKKSTFSHTADLINEWYENKKHFLTYLDDNLIWEGPSISLNYTPEIKKSIFNQFLCEAESYAPLDWQDWMVVNEAGFFDNVVVEPLYGTDMKKGMKLIKAFKFFDLNQKDLRCLQDLASQVIQKTKIEGTLCLSIHPLDFLSLSNNNANWRSCHALDGEYRVGNLSYMLDKTTIICYIKSKEDVVLKGFPPSIKWNSKKWRVLLHGYANGNIMYVNRQYPFSCDDLIYELIKTTPMCKMGFGETVINNLYMAKAQYIKDKGFREINGNKLSHNYFLINGYIADPQQFCDGDPMSLQYNDFIFSPHYTPEYILPAKKGACYFEDQALVKHHFAVQIGERVPCPCCGTFFLEDSCNFLCENCQDKIDGVVGFCEECGSRICDDDDYIVLPNGAFYCKICKDQIDYEVE